jgi:hypothetical protein
MIKKISSELKHFLVKNGLFDEIKLKKLFTYGIRAENFVDFVKI